MHSRDYQGMSRQVLIELRGGLGNQLFQYYAGAFQAIKSDSKLEIDMTHLYYSHEEHSVRSVKNGDNFLTLLNLPGKTLIRSKTSYEIEKSVRKILKPTKYFDTHLLTPKLFSRSHEPRVVGFDPILGTKHFRRIGGYFQTYHYFESVTNSNPEYLPKLEEKSDWFKETLKCLENERVVAVHVRKHYAWLNETFYQCDKKYYSDAFEYLNHKLGDFRILVFGTKDLKLDSFIPANLIEKCDRMTPPDESPDVESLILMSKSPALVTANSTFSWWAGKFASENQIVIAPKKIYVNKPNPEDFYPDGWVTI